MAHHKLLLDDDYEENFSLVAIHCSEDAFKMAFLLNKFASLRLARKKVDLEFVNDGLEVNFPLFEFDNQLAYLTYFLVANKCRSISAKLVSTGGLFSDVNSEKWVNTYLLPEYKNVDFFLKIESESENVPIKKLILRINEIKEVISAYEVEPAGIKSINNLIFY